jgi:hypothetical protein
VQSVLLIHHTVKMVPKESICSGTSTSIDADDVADPTCRGHTKEAPPSAIRRPWASQMGGGAAQPPLARFSYSAWSEIHEAHIRK